MIYKSMVFEDILQGCCSPPAIQGHASLIISVASWTMRWLPRCLRSIVVPCYPCPSRRQPHLRSQGSADQRNVRKHHQHHLQHHNPRHHDLYTHYLELKKLHLNNNTTTTPSKFRKHGCDVQPKPVDERPKLLFRRGCRTSISL